jgi:hypothetical protein
MFPPGGIPLILKRALVFQSSLLNYAFLGRVRLGPSFSFGLVGVVHIAVAVPSLDRVWET